MAWGSAAYFMSILKDDKGDPLLVVKHNRLWITEMQYQRLLCLLAPRDHGKTWTSLSYIAWRLWRHNRGPDGRLLAGGPEGTFEVVMFSSNTDISGALFERLKAFLLDNLELFEDILPEGVGDGASRAGWSKGKITLRNGASVVHKGVGSATRGLHPDLVVVDDILSDKNSLTPLQRGRVWSYLMGTISPMPGPDGQLLIIGTAQHYDDALHKLRKDKRFRWLKFRAVNWLTRHVLWPGRHTYEDLEAIRDADPIIFSKEYQNDPRDDAASLFPMTLTAKAVNRGKVYGFLDDFPIPARDPGDVIVGGCDIAISESVGADYTVIMVAIWNKYTGRRRLIYALRERGLTFDEQVENMADMIRRYNIDLMVIEQNVAQKWLLQHLRKNAITASHVYGHTTGIEKQSLVDGIPSLKIILQNDLWELPTGDEASKQFVQVWRSELQAFGYVEGKLQGIGAHDDTVMSWYLLERAIRMFEAMPQMPSDDLVVGEEYEMGRYVISADL